MSNCKVIALTNQKGGVGSKRQIARLGQLAFLCDTLKDTKKLVVF